METLMPSALCEIAKVLGEADRGVLVVE